MTKPIPDLSPDEWMKALRSAHAARAEFFHRVFEELIPVMGEEEAVALLRRATHASGMAKRPRYEAYLNEEGEHSPGAFCRVLVGHSDLVAKLFEMELGDQDDEHAEVRLCRCVLVDGWRSMSLDEARIATLCRAARGVDYGTLEGLGLKGEFDELLSEGGSSCHLIVQRDQENE